MPSQIEASGLRVALVGLGSMGGVRVDVYEFNAVVVGIDWLTPVGPLTFTFAHPVTKEPTDIEQTFRFNIGTSF